jgi:hypothetical protein
MFSSGVSNTKTNCATKYEVEMKIIIFIGYDKRGFFKNFPVLFYHKFTLNSITEAT